MIKYISRITIYFSIACMILLGLVSCKHDKVSAEIYTDTLYSPQYASGFAIIGVEGKKSVMITVSDPWQGADSVTTRLLILRDGESEPDGFDGQIMKGDAKRIVTLSSSHVAMLDAVDRIEAVVGVSGVGYISNPYIAMHHDRIGDIGYEGNIDYELLTALDPDIVLLYGVNGASEMESKLKELHIPFMYVGDYLEESPLGKAEWMVALAEVTGNRTVGADRFKTIADRYNALKSSLVSVDYRPKVMINTPYGDSWFMPSSKNYISLLISDAGGEYIYKDNNSRASMPIDMETAYMLTSQADKWINVGTCSTLEQLRESVPKFADLKPVIDGEVYNCTLMTNSGGGNDFWESGVVRPDAVLSDMIKIFHPEIAGDIPFNYYIKLQ